MQEKLSLQGIMDILSFLEETEKKVSLLKAKGLVVTFNYDVDSLSNLPMKTLIERIDWNNL